jgi:hypothetical protein
MFKSLMRSVPHGNRDVLVEYRGINTCVDTDWKIVSGIIADAEREEDAGYIEHILFMSKEWLRPIGLRGLMPHLAISGQITFPACATVETSIGDLHQSIWARGCAYS